MVSPASSAEVPVIQDSAGLHGLPVIVWSNVTLSGSAYLLVEGFPESLINRIISD